MIKPIAVECPNPNHPFGVKGVGEVSICSPMAAIANAIADAVGRRMTELPISPPKLSDAMDNSSVAEI
jgi:CO/xanthine dehydrogenase Mo-binding subunit